MSAAKDPLVGQKFPRKNVDKRPRSSNYESDSSSTEIGQEASKDEILGPLIKEFKKIMIEGRGSEPVSAYIIPNYDPHMSEYLPAPEQRLTFLTGFTGTAGTAIILRDAAAFWTDSRFYIQATQELEEGWIIYKIGDPEAMSEVEFLKNNLSPGDSVGADAKLMPYPIWQSIKKELKHHDIKLVHLSTNLVDALWGEAKPKIVVNPIQPLGQEYAGRTITSKLEEIRNKMEEKSTDILILNQLDDIAWLLNLRGTDIPYCPVFLAFMVISLKTVDVFTDKRRIQYKAGLQLIQENLDIRFLAYERIYEFIKYLRDYPLISKIWLGPTVSYYIYNMIPESKKYLEQNPVELMKCVKNQKEVKGMEQAHIKDGVALVQFLFWLEDEITRRGVTELEAAEKLDSFREMEYGYMGRSFPTVSASGQHSAILNYIPTPESSHVIAKEEIYLLDSGAQYIDGTTDISRTFLFSEPTDFMIDCYTRVLKGLIAVSTQIFPKGTPGRALDTLARKALWDVGLNYRHGSGHGIGCFLYAHESPVGISWKQFPEEMGLVANMFVTIEPGFYSEEEFGIRIENVLKTVDADPKYNMNDSFITFETVTLCPIQTKLLDLTALTESELKALNRYHTRVRETLTPPLVERHLTVEIDWLNNSTKPFPDDKLPDTEKSPDEEP
uniref:Xaa-Pro aminopeptidase 1 n=1 Tax=Lygus hesperus TaxID=30085 RepID=A0A0A9WMZ8_LYGHE